MQPRIVARRVTYKFLAAAWLPEQSDDERHRHTCGGVAYEYAANISIPVSDSGSLSLQQSCSYSQLLSSLQLWTRCAGHVREDRSRAP